MKTKRKFIEGHSYLEIHKFTRVLSFWELEESFKAMELYMKEPHDSQIPVCIRLKEGDIRVKKYDEQIGLDPTDYYSNVDDLNLIVYNAYNSRIAIKERFLSDEIKPCPQYDVTQCTPEELLNLKEFLEDLTEEDWIYFDIEEKEDGKKFYILEVVDSNVVRTISKSALSEEKVRNTFLFKYGDKNTHATERKYYQNFLNNFRPSENLLLEVYDAIDEL